MSARIQRPWKRAADRCVALAAAMPVAGAVRIVREHEARERQRVWRERQRVAAGQGRLWVAGSDGGAK